jgi:cell pole-organizing protein PopZ
MEEILASIRRILNDDEVPAPPAAAAPAPAEEEDDDDVLILDQSMLVAEPDPDAAAEPEAAEPHAAIPEIADALPETRAPFQQMEAATSAVRPDPFDLPAPTPDLVAPEAAAAAASSVGSLVRTLAAGRATQVYGGGPTLEDMVRAELRPLLKEWLDANLPPMVERLVRVEIERVVGRAVP